MVTKNKVIDVLKTIPDPEIGVSLWDLGLIYGIDIDRDQNVTVTMTLTTIGCPLFNLIADPVRAEVGRIRGVKAVNVELTFDPPWNTDKMSDAAKQVLGFS